MLFRRPPPHLTEEEKRQHPTWRRYTAHYRRKRRLARDVWLIGSLVAVCLPLGAIPVFLLGTTFVAFMILDETP